MQIKAPISPGEFFDKLTILVNKVFYCTEEHQIMWAIIGLIELAGCSPGFAKGDLVRISQELLNLRNTNKELWELEELVRVETDAAARLMMSDRIRELNGERWECKNWLDEQLDGIEEVKNYGTITNHEPRNSSE